MSDSTADFRVGDLVQLVARTRHGANRIRQHGDTWRIQSTTATSLTIRSMAITPERRDLRNVQLPHDEDFTVKSVPPEHQARFEELIPTLVGYDPNNPP